MKMVFNDLKSQHAVLRDEIGRRINAVLEHGQFINGPEVTELEQHLANYVGVKHAISCSSGTDALLLVLMAWGIGPGDAVFTTPFTFVATAEVISLLGATPVFVDVDAKTFNLDPWKLQAAIDDVAAKGILRPKAIIPVDIFGVPADYESINKIAQTNNLKVLEDAAQSFGAEYRGCFAGALGDAAATSFFPAKPLGCYGDGGAVFTNSDDLAECVSSLKVHGKGQDKYDNVRIGLNARLDTIQAAILLAKLAIFPEELVKKRHIATAYTRKIDDSVAVQDVPAEAQSAWAQFSLLSDSRDLLLDRLTELGIPTAVYYRQPLHLQRAFSELGYQQGDFPVAEDLSRRILSLPMHPYLQEADIACVADSINEILFEASAKKSVVR